MTRAFVVVLLAAAIIAAIAALEWYSHAAAGIASGGPVPLQSIPPRPTFAPSTTAASSSPVTAQTPAAKTTPGTAAPVATATAAAIQNPTIVSTWLSTSVASAGQIVSGTVATSPDVISVQASIAGYTSPLTKVSTGYFALSARIPDLPPLLRRTYTIQVVARNAAGRTASSSLPITIR